jgi:hypothetical protein
VRKEEGETDLENGKYNSFERKRERKTGMEETSICFHMKDLVQRERERERERVTSSQGLHKLAGDYRPLSLILNSTVSLLLLCHLHCPQVCPSVLSKQRDHTIVLVLLLS